jgi:hypothetical protein
LKDSDLRKLIVIYLRTEIIVSDCSLFLVINMDVPSTSDAFNKSK